MTSLLKYFSLYTIIFFLFFATSCKDDDNVNINSGSDQAINTWIHEVMKDVYYWTDFLPNTVNKELAPDAFFESLRYADDRFSIIVPDYQELINALEGVTKEAGYEFELFLAEEGSNALVAIVSYVKPDSPASNAGLKRGDIISHINGTAITTANYIDLYEEFFSTHSLSFSRFDEGSTMFEPQPEISLHVVELQENPNYLDTVYTINDHVIGYYVYNFFSNGLTENNEYDQQMDDIFASFKSKGITDLVVDLRYNGGGAISSALNLASLIGEGVGPEDIFYENRWNDNYMEHIRSLEDGEDILKGKFLMKEENVGNSLNESTVYILTGDNTASASELIINGLFPFMNVVLVGDETVGKNVGSIPIEDTENESNNYGLLPIAFQVYNSAGQSDYGDGFTPNPSNQVEDFTMPMKPLGDVEEILLSRAIGIITGSGPDPSRISSVPVERTKIMSSLDKKIRSNKIIMMPESENFKTVP